MSDPSRGSFEAIFFSDLIPDARTLTALLFAFEKVWVYDRYLVWGFYEAEELASESRDIEIFGKRSPRLPLLHSRVLGSFEPPHQRFRSVDDFSLYYTRFFEDNRQLFKEGILNFGHVDDSAMTTDLLQQMSHITETANREIRERGLTGSRVIDFERKANSLWCAAWSRCHHIPLAGEHARSMPRVSADVRTLSATLAFKALQLGLPSLQECSTHEILEVRDELKDYLSPFWRYMNRLSFQLSLLLREHESSRIEDINSEAERVVQSLIVPDLEELRESIKVRKGRLFRRIFGRAMDVTTMVARIFDPTEVLSKWDLVDKVVHGVLEITESNLKKCDRDSALAYMLAIPKAIGKKKHLDKRP